MNKIAYHFKTAFNNICRNIAMSISSSVAVMVTLTLVMLFVIIAANINTMSGKVESSVEIFAQIDTIVTEDQYPVIEEQLNAIEHVKSVTFSSKEEQKEIFLNSDLGGEEYQVMFEEGNPLSAAFYVEADKGENVQAVSDACKSVDGIVSAEFGGESATSMLEAFKSIQFGGSILVAALCLLAVFLISNTIKITINARKNEIAIMRNVGASNGFIKIPFMIEGMIIGFTGSIIPVLIAVFGYGFAYDAMNGIMFSSLFPMIAPLPFVLYMSIGLALLGMIVGIVGSFFAVNKNLKWKR